MGSFAASSDLSDVNRLPKSDFCDTGDVDSIKKYLAKHIFSIVLSISIVLYHPALFVGYTSRHKNSFHAPWHRFYTSLKLY